MPVKEEEKGSSVDAWLQHPNLHKQNTLTNIIKPWVGGSSPPSNHLIFGCLRNSF